MLNMQGKGRRGRPKKRWLDNIRDDMREYKLAQNRSVWHTKTKAGPLLHGGGVKGSKTGYIYSETYFFVRGVFVSTTVTAGVLGALYSFVSWRSLARSVPRDTAS